MPQSEDIISKDDFHFPKLSAEENVQRVLYEYARESDYVAWLYSQIDEEERHLKTRGRKLSRSPNGDIEFYVIWMDCGWILRLPASYRDWSYGKVRALRPGQFIARKVESGPGGRWDREQTLIAEYELGDLRYQNRSNIDPRAFSSDSNPRPSLLTADNPFAWRFRFGWGTKLLAVAPYGSVSEKVEAFKAWLKKESGTRAAFVPGDSNFADWLNQLAAFRLLKAFERTGETSIAKAAEQYCVKHGVNPPYRQKSQWSEAWKVEKRMRWVNPWIIESGAFPPPPPPPPVISFTRYQAVGSGVFPRLFPSRRM